eukprot:TRINITY_DN22108_c0_g1_i1.p1 TRINITY_DN22108_c0_g1~~TRINITY_DN22108_c0_g1_i1.p1  ORF type:complete len:600 (-),score=101.34 TRINITY_DN22108_c0_g1_i1:86-1885(-)
MLAVEMQSASVAPLAMPAPAEGSIELQPTDAPKPVRRSGRRRSSGDRTSPGRRSPYRCKAPPFVIDVASPDYFLQESYARPEWATAREAVQERVNSIVEDFTARQQREVQSRIDDVVARGAADRAARRAEANAACSADVRGVGACGSACVQQRLPKRTGTCAVSSKAGAVGTTARGVSAAVASVTDADRPPTPRLEDRIRGALAAAQLRAQQAAIDNDDIVADCTFADPSSPAAVVASPPFAWEQRGAVSAAELRAQLAACGHGDTEFDGRHVDTEALKTMVTSAPCGCMSTRGDFATRPMCAHIASLGHACVHINGGVVDTAMPAVVPACSSPTWRIPFACAPYGGPMGAVASTSARAAACPPRDTRPVSDSRLKAHAEAVVAFELNAVAAVAAAAQERARCAAQAAMAAMAMAATIEPAQLVPSVSRPVEGTALVAAAISASGASPELHSHPWRWQPWHSQHYAASSLTPVGAITPVGGAMASRPPPSCPPPALPPPQLKSGSAQDVEERVRQVVAQAQLRAKHRKDSSAIGEHVHTAGYAASAMWLPPPLRVPAAVWEDTTAAASSASSADSEEDIERADVHQTFASHMPRAPLPR